MTSTLPPILQNMILADMQVILQPINKFLTDLQQPNVNYQTVLQDFAVLQLALLQDAPILQSVGIQNLAQALQTALNNWVATFNQQAPTAKAEA